MSSEYETYLRWLRDNSDGIKTAMLDFQQHGKRPQNKLLDDQRAMSLAQHGNIKPQSLDIDQWLRKNKDDLTGAILYFQETGTTSDILEEYQKVVKEQEEVSTQVAQEVAPQEKAPESYRINMLKRGIDSRDAEILELRRRNDLLVKQMSEMVKPKLWHQMSTAELMRSNHSLFKGIQFPL